MAGPWLPLYGFGLCLLYLLTCLEPYFALEGWLSKILLFVIMAISMTAIEYIAGIVSIKLLKVHLWDYSNEWGNINGIICPRFSCFWAILGIAYYFLIHPYVIIAISRFAQNLLFSYAIGFYYGIFSVDVFCSCKILARIRSFAKENNIIVKYSRLRKLINDTISESKERRRTFFAFRYTIPCSEHFANYIDWLKINANIVKEVIEDNSSKAREGAKPHR